MAKSAEVKGYTDGLDVAEIVAAKREVGQSVKAWEPDASNKTIPDAWEGASFEIVEPRKGSTLDETIENLRPFIENGDDDTVLAAVIHDELTSSIRLKSQKAAKDDEPAQADADEAQNVLAAYRLTEPGTRRTGSSRKTKADLLAENERMRENILDKIARLRDAGMDDLADEMEAEAREDGLL